MFGRHSKKRSAFLPFAIFRLFLSVAIFVVLLVGIYTAYKQFSGFDPAATDPKAVIATLLKFLPFDLKKKPVIYESAPAEQLKELKIKSPQPQKAKLTFTFGLVADVHNDNALLKKALAQMKDVSFIIGLGDYTDVGTLGELQDAKKILDESKTRYFVIAGDHDLWDSRDKQRQPTFNFKQVFGSRWQSFEHQGVAFMLLDNSDNYQGFGEEQIDWLSRELEKFKKADNVKLRLAFVHQPLYHPSSDHIMGRVEPSLKDQAKKVTKILKSGEVKKVFAGDIHFFSQYNEPDTNLAMVTVGAVTTQRNPQLPRFALVRVFDDGTSEVEDVEIIDKLK